MSQISFRAPGPGTQSGIHLPGSRLAAALSLCATTLSLAPLVVLLVTRALVEPAGAVLETQIIEQSSNRLTLLVEWAVPQVVLAAAVLALARFLDHRDAASLIVGSVLAVTFPLESIHLVGQLSSLAPTRVAWAWVVARLFTSLALILGIGLLQTDRTPPARRRLAAASVWTLGGAAIAVTLALVASPLPAFAIDPAGPPGRAWVLGPMALFAAALLLVFPWFHRQRPTTLSFALLLSAIPQLMHEIQAGFFTGGPGGLDPVLTDTQRLLAYTVLFVGLVWGYAKAPLERQIAERDLLQARTLLDQEAREADLARRQLTQAREERDRLEQSQRTLQTAVETVRLGITVTDLEGIIQYVNPADAKMHGYRREELLGKSAGLYGHGDRQDLTPHPPPARFWDRETVNVRKDGTKFPARLISEVVTDREGKAVGLLTICDDLSEKKEVERLKEDFLASVSHELRSSLTSIVAALDLVGLEEFDLDAAGTREMFDIAYRNSHRLMRSVDDLLLLQRLRAGRLEFRIEPVAVQSVLESAMAEFRLPANAHPVLLELRDEFPGALVQADRGRLLKVLAHLLSNAIKYSRPGEDSRVLLSASAKGDNVCISIADDGPGIPEESLDRLFEPFFRVDSSTQQEGTGLGLSIVKGLMDGMEGSVSIDSRLGHGTTLHLILPRALSGDVG